MTLCACSWLSSSHAKVTSKKSFSSLNSRNAPLTFCSKSFQRRQNFSEDAISNCSSSQFLVFPFLILPCQIVGKFLTFLVISWSKSVKSEKSRRFQHGDTAASSFRREFRSLRSKFLCVILKRFCCTALYTFTPFNNPESQEKAKSRKQSQSLMLSLCFEAKCGSALTLDDLICQSTLHSRRKIYFEF